jgi:hypothetical protein
MPSRTMSRNRINGYPDVEADAGMIISPEAG